MGKEFRKPARTSPVPITYKSLRKVLVDRNMNMTDLRKAIGFSTGAGSSLNNDRPVSLDTIAKICQFLDVPIEQVVEVLPKEKTDKQ